MVINRRDFNLGVSALLGTFVFKDSLSDIPSNKPKIYELSITTSFNLEQIFGYPIGKLVPYPEIEPLIECHIVFEDLSFIDLELANSKWTDLGPGKSEECTIKNYTIGKAGEKFSITCDYKHKIIRYTADIIKKVTQLRIDEDGILISDNRKER